MANNSCNSFSLQRLITDALDYLGKSGLHVVGIVSDMGSNFIQHKNQLGVTEQRPYLFENGKIYFYFFDAPHALAQSHKQKFFEIRHGIRKQRN